MTLRAAVVVAFCTTGAAAVSFTGTAGFITRIEGTVVDSVNGGGIPEAVVKLQGRNLDDVVSAVSDRAGHFVMQGNVGRPYELMAERRGYLPAYFGSRSPDHKGVSVEFSGGEVATGFDITLTRSAVLEGTLRSIAGNPVQGARMWIIEQSAGVQPQKTSRTVITDDRGQYRFFDLAPHSYVLAATVYEPFAAPQFFTRRGAARERPVPTYYPGVTNESYAQAISVSAGEHQSAIDFTIQTAPSTIVTGTVGGRPEDRLECSILLVQKQQSYSAARVSESYRQDAAVDGSFRFVDVSPGQYWIQARIVSSSQGREILWAAQDINVMSDDLRVVLTPRPASKVLGRLHVQSSIAQTLFQTRHTVSLIPARDFLYGASGSVAALLDTFNGEVSSDGTFVIPGLPAGRYKLSVIPARPGVSMYLNIDNHLAIDDVRDVAVVVEEPGPLKLEIEVFEQPQRLSGRLTAPAPIVASSFQVLVFPVNRSYWTGISQIRSVVVREDGQYQVSGLRPGDYYVAAVADIREQELGDVQFLLAQSKLGSRVSIAPGQEAVHNIAVDPNQLRGPR